MVQVQPAITLMMYLRINFVILKTLIYGPMLNSVDEEKNDKIKAEESYDSLVFFMPL